MKNRQIKKHKKKSQSSFFKNTKKILTNPKLIAFEKKCFDAVKPNLSLKNKNDRKMLLQIFLIPIAFVYFEILLRLFGDTALLPHFIYPTLFALGTGLLISSIFCLFPNYISRILTLLSLLISGIIFIVECLIQRSFQFYMPFGAIRTGAGGVTGNYTLQLLSAILHGIPAIILFLLPSILYFFKVYKLIPPRKQRMQRAARIFLYSVMILGFAILISNIGASRAAYKTQYKFDTATKYFGLITSMRLNSQYDTVGNSADVFIETDGTLEAQVETSVSSTINMMDLPLEEINNSTSDETILSMNHYVASLTPSEKNDYTDIFKGKNLILICAEAFSDVVIDKNLTPTLYRLTRSGFYFPEFYQPNWGGSTTTGEYSFLTGLVPLDSAETIQRTQDKNMYFTMGSQLQRLGYTSFAYHNGDYDYYNRQLTHENFGYDQYLGLGNGLEEITDWWPTDEVMFDKTMDTFIDKQPFSIYYMTISGHCIYTEDNALTKKNLKAVRDVVGDKYKDTTTYYLCYQLELEHALTRMIEKLDEAGITDDTVICLTSDHYPYGLENTATFNNTEDYVADLYGGDPKYDWERDHNTLIIWSGCLENEHKDKAVTINEPTYSLDILPTLSNLFGVEYDSRLMVGRDVFSETEALALWNDYSWATVKGKYDAASGKFFPNAGENVDQAYIDNISAIVSNKISFSKKVLDQDYYNVLFGN